MSPSLLVQLELALHAADCSGHGRDFEGHGDKYTKLAKAAMSVFPPNYEPYWLQDRKLVQEASLGLIFEKLAAIEKQVQHTALVSDSDLPTWNEFVELVSKVLPGAQVDTDNVEQVTIYTGYALDVATDRLVSFKSPD